MARDTRQSAETLLAVIGEVMRELHPHRAGGPLPGLDSRLEQELGFDSLGRVELVQRVEHAFAVALPDAVLASVETPRDLLRAISVAGLTGSAERVEREHAVRHVALDAVEAAPERALTLLEMLDWHVQAHPERPHVMLHGQNEEIEEITYGHLHHIASEAAAALQAHDLRPGESVAIMLPTGAEYLASFFGVLMAGGVPVPIYPPARASQIEDHLRRHISILNNAQVKILVTVPEARSVALLLRAHVDGLHTVLAGSEMRGDPGSLARPRARPEDLAFLQYTSGSTGNPKGVMLSHANLLANIRAMGRAARVDSTDVFVSWLPLYHDMGLIGAWLGSMYHAFPLALLSPLAFLARPERWLWAVHRHRGTLSAAPNFAYELCLRRIRDEKLQGLDLSSWRFTVNGAEPVSADTLRGFQKRFAAYGLRSSAVAPVYGLAECSVGLAFSPPGREPIIDSVARASLMLDGQARAVDPGDPAALHMVACGQPLPGHQIRIVDETGREVGDRQEGRLQFRGPSATAGYLRNPEETRKLFDGDWLNSGDLAYTVAGDIYLTGRVKDVIIRAGRNLYPYELEEAVGAIEGIRSGCVAVFGSTDRANGTERLVILAETRERDEGDREALRRAIGELAVELLGGPPDEVVLAPPHTVLKTSSGKIRRGACRNLYERGEIGARRAVWWQLARVSAAAFLPQLRRSLRLAIGFAYAAWWWLILLVLAPFLWLPIVAVPSRRWAWFITQSVGRLFLRMTGTQIQLSGENHLAAAQPCVYVVNHQSYLDGLAVCSILPAPAAFVAKRELATQWVAGIFLRRLGCEFVERFDKQRGLEDARRVTRQALRGRSLVYFPEGTFFRMPGLQAFQMGAFSAAAEAGLPVVPIALRGTRMILRDTSWFPRRGRIAVTVRPPIVPDGRDWNAAIRLRDRARAEILQHCGEPDLAPPSTE